MATPPASPVSRCCSYGYGSSVERAALVHHSKQRQPRRARSRPRSVSAVSNYLAAVLLLSLLAVALPLGSQVGAVAGATVDFDALTWTQWRALYDASAAAMTLERVYRTSPRVRAKLLVAKQTSMSQLLAGEAILRQQLSDVAGVSMARVQLEVLQTSALKESDSGEYFAAFGISAIPDPMSLVSGQQDLSNSVTLATAIDQERGRIITRLRYGAVVRDQNVTIASLTLFGSAMKLVDVSLDGESFYAIDLKPWIAVRIAVVPAGYTRSTTSVSSSGASGSTSSSATSQTSTSLYYEPSHDAFQSLRLRFLLTKTLLPLRLTLSDILIRGTTAPVAFSAYRSGSASVVDVEVHMDDASYRVAVDGYLRNSSLAQAFSAVEPQWAIAAIDVGLGSGLLYSPPAPISTGSGSAAATVATSSNALELAFELNGVPFAQIADRKWRILERLGQWLALNGCYSCQARFNSVSATAATIDSSRASHNDGDNVDETTTALDPINAKSTALGFQVATSSSNDPSVLYENLQRQVSSGPEAALCSSIGVVESAATVGVVPETCALISYRNASAASAAATVSLEPFVLLNLTLGLADQALNASVTTAEVASSAFDRFRIRCALSVLFQQVAIYDEHMTLQSTSVISTTDSVQSDEPLLLLIYKVVIADESQRQGIKALFLSKRFQRTLSEYTQQRLSIVGRVADLHADGSPWWLDIKLPGIAFSLEDATASTSLESLPSTSSSGTRIYRYQDPLEGSNPSVVTFPVASSAPTCSSATTASPSSLECISIQFTSEFDSDAPLFIRRIESNVEISSPSLVMPTASQSEAASSYVAAPRIASNQSTGDSASYPWVFYADTSSLSQRLTASGSNSTMAVVMMRFQLELTTGLGDAGGGSQSRASAFRLDVRVEINSTGVSSRSRQVSVHKSSFLSLITASPDADGRSANASTAFGHLYLDPLVSAQVQVHTSATAGTTSSGGHSAVTFRIYPSSIGGFFYRTQVTSSDQPSSSTSCSSCDAKLEACDASLECRALSACFSAAANSDPALYASLLLQTSTASSLSGDSSSSNGTTLVTHDLSWLLQQCLGGSADGSTWTTPTLVRFVDGLLCTSSSQCPIETTSNSTSSSISSESAVLADGPSRALVVRYTPMEQTLTFPDSNFTTTLQFLIDADDGSEKSQVFTDLTRDDTSLSALQAMLMQLYGGEQSTTSFLFVQVSRNESSSGGAEEVVHIRYFFLSTWTTSSTSSSSSLPYVQSVSGDSPVVKTTVGAERLELVVMDV